jgi:hypothetical protein
VQHSAAGRIDAEDQPAIGPRHPQRPVGDSDQGRAVRIVRVVADPQAVEHPSGARVDLDHRRAEAVRDP